MPTILAPRQPPKNSIFVHTPEHLQQPLPASEATKSQIMQTQSTPPARPNVFQKPQTMKKIKNTLLIGLILVSSGCATTTSQETIDYAARLFYFSNLCSQAGMLDRNLAAKGISIANSKYYQSDSSRVQEKARQMWASGERATQSTCSSIELQIMAEDDARNARAKAPTPSYSIPRQTTCSTYFGHTNCTTY